MQPLTRFAKEIVEITDKNINDMETDDILFTFIVMSKIILESKGLKKKDIRRKLKEIIDING